MIKRTLDTVAKEELKDPLLVARVTSLSGPKKREAIRNLIIDSEIHNLDVSVSKDEYKAKIKSIADGYSKKYEAQLSELHDLYAKHDANPKDKSIGDQIAKKFDGCPDLAKARAYLVLASALHPDQYRQVLVTKDDEVVKGGYLNKIRQYAQDGTKTTADLHGACVEAFDALCQQESLYGYITITNPADSKQKVRFKRTGYFTFEVKEVANVSTIQAGDFVRLRYPERCGNKPAHYLEDNFWTHQTDGKAFQFGRQK